MTRPSLIIELTPAHFEMVVLVSGHAVGGAQIDLDPAAWEEVWAGGLSALDGALAQAVADLHVAGRAATVLHASPSSACEVFSYPSKPRAACDAAVLALGDQVSYPLEENPHATVCLTRDTTGSPNQSHVLIAADTEHASRSVGAWLERAGLTARQILPIDAPHLSALVREASGPQASDVTTTIALRVGENNGALAAGARGRLTLIRHVSVGIAMLIEAMMRPIQPKAPDAREIRLSRSEARELLFRRGIPTPEEIVDESRGLHGADILPLLQPILQRCIVEMRQSLRFGLEENERQAGRLTLIGPGAAVPRLAEVLAGQLGLALGKAADQVDFDPFALCATGSDLHDAIAQPPLDVNLLPSTVAAEVGLARFRRALWAGTTLAAVLALGEAGLTYSNLRSVRREIDGLRNAADAGRILMVQREAAAADERSLALVRQGLSRTIGASPAWTAWLREIAALTPRGIRLMEVAAVQDGESIRSDLRGFVIAEAGAAQTTPEAGEQANISNYLKSLDDSPLTRSVRLGATQRTSINDRDALQFAVSAEIVSLPVVTGGDPGSEP